MTGSKSKKGYYILQTDGSMYNDGHRTKDDAPGAAGIGIVLKDSKDRLVEKRAVAIGLATNDVAEYHALIEGLKLARDLGVGHLRAFMDSEFIVEQVNGRAQVNEAHLKPLFQQVQRLREAFSSLRVSWIPREWNAEADELAANARRSILPS